jgi:hypothetical protein|tara:strand:+ start:1449 stop:1649 length:201 start_codon:yes stop_codon:yes gene_type:complete
MSMNREQRVANAQTQDRIFVSNGQPNLNELQNHVPVFRKVGDNIIQYVRVDNRIYQSTFQPLQTVG